MFSARAIARILLAITISYGTSLFAADSEFNIDSYKGQVVYVDFWASWCAPCRESFPWLKTIQQAYGARDFTVIAINVDEDHQLAEDFLKEFKPSFPIVFDPKGKLAEKFGVEGMPTSFIIDRTGKTRFSHPGFRLSDRDGLEAKIRSLLPPQ